MLGYFVSCQLKHRDPINSDNLNLWDENRCVGLFLKRGVQKPKEVTLPAS